MKMKKKKEKIIIKLRTNKKKNISNNKIINPNNKIKKKMK